MAVLKWDMRSEDAEPFCPMGIRNLMAKAKQHPKGSQVPCSISQQHHDRGMVFRTCIVTAGME
jgi:hypothetical protein